MADQERLRELYQKLRELEAESELAKKYRAEIRHLLGLRKLYSDDPIPDQYIYRANGTGNSEVIELTMPLWLRKEFLNWLKTSNPAMPHRRRPDKALRLSRHNPARKKAKSLAVAFIRAKVQEHSEALVAHV